MLVAFSRCEGKREKRHRQDFENGATRPLFHPLALPLPENAAEGSPNHAKSVFLAEYAAQGSLSQISRQANHASLKTRQRSALLSKGKPQVTKSSETNNPNPSEKKRLLAAQKALSTPTKCPLRGISCQKVASNPAFMTLARRFLPRTQSPYRIQRELSFAPPRKPVERPNLLNARSV